MVVGKNGTVMGCWWGGRDSNVRPRGAMHRMLLVSYGTVDLTTIAVFSFPLCTFSSKRLDGRARPFLWRSLFSFVVDRYSRMWGTSQSCTPFSPGAMHPFLPSMHTWRCVWQVVWLVPRHHDQPRKDEGSPRSFPVTSILVAPMPIETEPRGGRRSVPSPWFPYPSRHPCAWFTVGSETFFATRAHTNGTVATPPRLVYVLLPKPRHKVPWIYAWCRWNRNTTCRWNACRRSAIQPWVNGS
mmetsp:Transcript_76/g.630  ORF Transcript_76/g.630 Transcript_76/m.630 type:complete len:241 (+) Transcript_76:1389-2111(+)